MVLCLYECFGLVISVFCSYGGLSGKFCSFVSGLTTSNYSELSQLYEKFKNQGELSTRKGRVCVSLVRISWSLASYVLIYHFFVSWCEIYVACLYPIEKLIMQKGQYPFPSTLKAVFVGLLGEETFGKTPTLEICIKWYFDSLILVCFIVALQMGWFLCALNSAELHVVQACSVADLLCIKNDRLCNQKLGF